MYAGTTAYFALRIQHISTDVAAVYSNGVLLYSDLRSCYAMSLTTTPGVDTVTCDTMSDFGLFAPPSRIDTQFCAGTAALTINVGRYMRLVRSDT